ncbi:MAG TPA: hypothetical protein VMH30_06030 [Verrucomicrobiae bacterium]|jgi:hypothetical protein|nr:hypothetical protein [Verrucomicrobiae bacterium]
MKIRPGQFLLLFALAAILFSVSGCKTNPPSNSSARPWNSPQDWEGGMPMMNEQHD